MARYKKYQHNYRDDVIVKDKQGIKLGKGTFICSGMSITLLNKVFIQILYIVNAMYGKILLEKNYCSDSEVDLPRALGSKTMFIDLKVSFVCYNAVVHTWVYNKKKDVFEWKLDRMQLVRHGMEKGIGKSQKDKGEEDKGGTGCQGDKNESEKRDQVNEGEIGGSDKIDDHEPISKYEEMRQKNIERNKEILEEIKKVRIFKIDLLLVFLIDCTLNSYNMSFSQGNLSLNNDGQLVCSKDLPSYLKLFPTSHTKKSSSVCPYMCIKLFKSLAHTFRKLRVHPKNKPQMSIPVRSPIKYVCTYILPCLWYELL